MDNFTRNIVGLAISIVSILGVLWGIGATVTHYVDQNFGDGTSGIFFVFVSAIVLTLCIVAVTMFLTNRTHQSAGDDTVAVVGGLRGALNADARAHGQIRVIDAKAQLEDHKTRNYGQRQEMRLVTTSNARQQRRTWAEEEAADARTEAERFNQETWGYDVNAPADDNVEIDGWD